jgi:hypothetical protein
MSSEMINKMLGRACWGAAETAAAASATNAARHRSEKNRKICRFAVTCFSSPSGF